MTLLSLLAGASPGVAPVLPVDDPEGSGVPYVMPAAAPYNVPMYAVTPTSDGTGSGLHPDVLDFWPDTFAGHRYWMAFTPWFRMSDPIENPEILHSDDGYTWSVPAGLTNPIDTPAGTGDAHLSDTDLVFDPDTGRLWCIYRGVPTATRRERIWAKWSTDGVTWSDRILIAEGPEIPVDSFMTGALSPSVLRLAPGAWVMFTSKDRWTATSIAGPWTRADPLIWTGTAASVWHLNAVWTGVRFWGLVDSSSGGIPRPAVSKDGVIWVVGDPLLAGSAGAWDSGRWYRSALTLHPEGGKVRIWYSAHPDEPADTTDVSWRVGYTIANASHWAALG